MYYRIDRNNMKNSAAMIGASLAFLVIGSTLSAAKGAGAQSIIAASTLKELPLKAWGPYNRAHLAPCCLVDQVLRQQFVFPIVISQQRQAIMPVRSVLAGEKPALRLMPVYLHRRAMGLAPVQAADDDRAPGGPLAGRNRLAHLTDANAEGLLWTYHIFFAPAGLTQKNAMLRNEKAEANTVGKGADPEAQNAWGAGEATIDCFPAFAEPEGDGLLLRVTLVNQARTTQNYCVDLLAGMDTPSIEFPADNFVVQAPPGQNSAVIRHGKCNAVFALASAGLPFRARCYRVSDAYFAPAGAIAKRDDAGAAIPNGLLAVTDKLPDSDNEDDQKELQKRTNKEAERAKKRSRSKDNSKDNSRDNSLQGQEATEQDGSLPKNSKQARQATSLPNDRAPVAALQEAPNRGREARDDGDNQYALNRVDNIAVAPGQSVTLYFSIGVGKDADTARISAQTLLSVTGDQNGNQNGNPNRNQNGNQKENASSSGAYGNALKAHQAARFQAGLPSLEHLMAQSLANTPNIEGRRLGVSTRQLHLNSTGTLYDPNHDALMALGWINYRPTFAAAQLNAWFQTKTNADDISGVPMRNPRAAPPTNLFAFWDLYQRTHDRALLKRYYPFARRRYLELLAAGRSKDDTWLFSWPQTAHDAVFIPGSTSANSGEHGNGLLLKPGAESGFLAAPDYAAYVIRSSHLMQVIAQLTDQPGTETRQYAVDALETIHALNTVLWDANQKLYLARPTPDSKAPAGRCDTLAGLLPLIAGAEAMTSEQRAAMLQALTNPDTFWSPYGLRTVSKASSLYRADDGANGAVRFGLNWLFWKALLDLGETETAHKLAVNLLQAYEKAQAASGASPEWLHGETGAGGGAQDYAGDACALLALGTAYHQAGVITSGWNVTLLDSSYYKPKDTMHLVVRRLQPRGAVVLLCGMGKPGSKYLCVGALAGTQMTDADGLLTLTLPEDNTTLVIDITPAS